MPEKTLSIKISKDIFVNIIRALRKQHRVEKEIGSALQKIESDNEIFSLTCCGNMLIDLLDLDDNFETVSWWLFDCDGISGRPTDLAEDYFENGETFKIETPEQLFDYLYGEGKEK